MCDSGRWEVRSSMMLTARARVEISVEMFVTRTPAWAPWVEMGVIPSSDRTTPTPPPPIGEGRGQAEPSVTRITSVPPWRGPKIYPGWIDQTYL